MKKIIISLLILLLFCSCNKVEYQKEQTKNSYDGIVNNTNTFIYESKSTYIKTIGNPQRYIYIDLDNDQIKELVVELDNNTQLIFHRYNDEIYANSVNVIKELKEDGTFVNNGYHYSISFYEDNFILDISDSTDEQNAKWIEAN